MQMVFAVFCGFLYKIQIEQNRNEKKTTVVKLPEAIKSANKIPEEKKIIADFISGMNYDQACAAFQERRKDSSKQASVERFRDYVKCGKFRKWAKDAGLKFE